MRSSSVRGRKERKVFWGGDVTLKMEFNLLQLQIKWKPSNFNTIYSVKINYQGPKVDICFKPFNLAAARKEILKDVCSDHFWIILSNLRFGFQKKVHIFLIPFCKTLGQNDVGFRCYERNIGELLKNFVYKKLHCVLSMHKCQLWPCPSRTASPVQRNSKCGFIDALSYRVENMIWRFISPIWTGTFNDL